MGVFFVVLGGMGLVSSSTPQSSVLFSGALTFLGTSPKTPLFRIPKPLAGRPGPFANPVKGQYAPSPMSDKLQALFDEFVSRARTLLIEEAMASFSALAQGGGGQPDPLLKAKSEPVVRFRMKPGPKPKSAAPAQKPAKRAKWQKRSPEELEALTKEIISTLKKRPGLRSEQLAATLNTTTKELALPLSGLVEAGTLKTKGQRRGMQYTVK